MKMMIMILMSLAFLGSSQPVSLAILMFFITMLFSIDMYMSSMTFWYGLILMVIMLSGVLVIFTYMASMSPNESFEVNWLTMFMLVLLSWKFIEKEMWVDSSVYSLKLWDEMVLMVNLMMVVFLLVIMMMVVWISDWWAGAIRS